MSFFSSLIQSDSVARARRRTVLGLTLSVLVHVILFSVLRAKLDTPPRLETPGKPDAPLQVTFIKPPAPRPEPPRAEPKPVEEPKKAVTKPAPKRAAPPRQSARAAPAQAPAQAPPTPNSITVPVAEAAPEMDFSSMMNRNRERRQAAEEVAAKENAAARAAENPSANDIARANIAFQERRGRGTNGVFEIISKGPRVAQYSFRGWTDDQRRSQRQTIEVDAGPGGNVEMAIVDSMIALIRKYYSGDFSWDSQRLGRVVTLSARQTDTQGLQAFLMKEFFSGR
jgi:outer membrane biosynthesis protein TonB